MTSAKEHLRATHIIFKKLNMGSFSYVLVISLLFSSMGQVGADLYLPSLPAIERAFHTSENLSQSTIFLYMIGFSASRLVYGPASDAIGRRKPLIFGMLLCMLGTALCVAANSITLLIIGRFIQGFGSGAGVVVAGAIVRDQLDGSDLARVYSYLGIANVLLIACAPMLGGYIEQLFNWRANFILLFLYASIAMFVSIFSLSETNKHKSMAHLKPSNIISNICTLFSSREFIVYNACLFLVYGGILAWITSGPILLQNYVGLTPVQFGWIATATGVFHILGSFLNSKFVKIASINNMLIVGASLLLFSGLLMLFLYFTYTINAWIVVIPVAIFITGGGFIFPNAYAGVMIPFTKIAGTAGAITGCIQILGGSLSSGLISIIPDKTQAPIIIIFIICGIISLILIQNLKRTKSGCV